MSTELAVIEKKTRRDFTTRERDKLIELRAAGLTYKVIGEQLGRCARVLERFCAQHGIKGRKPGGTRKMSKAQIAQALAMQRRGVSKKKIAETFGVSTTAINNLPGIQMRTRRSASDKIEKRLGMPVTFTPSHKRRLDAIAKDLGIARIQIIREGTRRELDRLERERDLGPDRRAYGL